jgi:hypothetical protein
VTRGRNYPNQNQLHQGLPYSATNPANVERPLGVERWDTVDKLNIRLQLKTRFHQQACATKKKTEGESDRATQKKKAFSQAQQRHIKGCGNSETHIRGRNNACLDGFSTVKSLSPSETRYAGLNPLTNNGEDNRVWHARSCSPTGVPATDADAI